MKKLEYSLRALSMIAMMGLEDPALFIEEKKGEPIPYENRSFMKLSDEEKKKLKELHGKDKKRYLKQLEEKYYGSY